MMGGEDKCTYLLYAECSAVFDQERRDPRAPPSLFTCSCLASSQVTFFICLFPRMKKVLKGKRVANVEEVKQKRAESLTGIKTDKFKHCVEQ